MSTYLFAACPIYGHVAPLLTLGTHLVERGHDVSIVTGARFAPSAEAAGIRLLPFPPEADFDEQQPEVYMPDRAKYTGLALVRYDIEQVFFARVPAQYRELQRALDALEPAAVIVDAAFAPAVPLMNRPPDDRPPLVGVGVLPLAALSRDTAPFGMGMQPSATTLGRIRNRMLNEISQRVVFRKTQRFVNRKLAEAGSPPSPAFVLDLSSAYDRFLQATAPGFEYPRSDLAPNLEFIGPILPAPRAAVGLPDWWHELDGGRPVVHVTQGTMDNKDFTRLVRPTLDALADLDLLVVVSGGGRPLADVGVLPTNARGADFLPYPELLPKLDVMVTNGGYGGVQYALSHGVPLVVAGDTEDKPEVAARVQYTGVGVNLRTGSPEPAAIRKAVQRVLGDPAFRTRATALAREFASYDTLTLFERELESLPRMR